MNDDKNHIEYLDLITLKLSGEITTAQEQQLEEWLDEKPEHRKLYAEYERIWQEMDRVQGKTTREVDEEWSRLEKAINFGEVAVHQPKERSLFTNIYRYAAAVLFMGIMAFLAYYFVGRSGSQSLVASADIARVELSEGTHVTVNAHSTLTYPKKFKADKREVQLSGEAYFQVARDPERPFIIAAGNIRVEVLGTEFNVRAYEQDEQVEVTVASGKVAVYDASRPGERTVLIKGQKAVFYKATTKIEKLINDDINFDAWKTKKIIFEDTPMSEVVRVLNEIYKSDIQLKNAELATCPVTTTFDNQPLESVLHVLESTLDLSVARRGEVIEITGEGC